MQPGVLQPFIARSGRADFVVFVVRLDEVLDDGAGFPEGEACIGICECGDTGHENHSQSITANEGWRRSSIGMEGRERAIPAIGILRLKFRLLQVWKVEVIVLIWKPKFLQNDLDFVWVRADFAAVEDEGFEGHGE